MRQWVMLLFCLVGLVLTHPTAAAPAKPDVTVKVKGMVCSFCAQGIEKKLLQLESVSRVVINLEVKTVEVWLKSSQTLGDDEIKRAITSAGYNIDTIDRAAPSRPQPSRVHSGPTAAPTSR